MSINWRGRPASYTRNFVRSNLPRARHPWLNTPLPPPPLPIAVRRPRGADAEGHAGAQGFEEWDVSEMPNPDDGPLDIGELMFPDDEAGTPTTHVRVKKGGYVDIVSHADLAVEQSKEKRAKRRAERARKEMRRGIVGAARRRWVWKNGKPPSRGGKGKKIVGEKRRRDDRGRFA